jgi:glycosyltransferase involved in cell wall biosynthesis
MLLENIDEDTDMQRIALFIPSLQGGGAERVMVTLANEFVGRGFVVDLILATAAGPYLSAVLPAVNIHDLGVSRVVKSLFPLIDYLKRYRPRALMSFMGHANIIAILAGKLSATGVRVVVSERSLVSGEQRVAKGFGANAALFLVRYLYGIADSVCSVSDGASRDLERFAHLRYGSVRTIYNPFDLHQIAERAAEPISHSWLTSKDSPVVLAVGRLNEAKGFDVLLEAFCILRQSRRARLMILGEGELRADLERLSNRLNIDPADFQMPGFSSNPYAWMASCSVFVLSSRREALPGVLIEAMACGAAIVSTDCDSGPNEILVGGKFGQLVPVGDAQALAKAINAVLNALPSELPNVRARAIDFKKETAVDSYLELLGLQ